MLGTLLYMAPEQLDGKLVGPAADVYALGLILCEMLTGRLPWGPKGADLPGIHLLRLAQPPLPLAELCPEQPFPRPLQDLLDATLRREPEARIRDAAEMEARARDLLARCPLPWAPAPAPAIGPSPYPLPQAGEGTSGTERSSLATVTVVSTPSVPAATLPTRRWLLPAGVGAIAALGLLLLLWLFGTGTPPPSRAAPDAGAGSLAHTAAPDLLRTAPPDLPRATPPPVPSEPQPGPVKRMIKLEFQIVTPTDRAVTIKCNGGTNTCRGAGRTCPVVARMDGKCVCTASAPAYDPATFSCGGQRQRFKVQLTPEKF